jgi:hypothetical protein
VMANKDDLAGSIDLEALESLVPWNIHFSVWYVLQGHRTLPRRFITVPI